MKVSGYVYERPNSPYWWIAYKRGTTTVRESSGKTTKQEAEELLRQRQRMIADEIISTVETKISDLVELVIQDYRLNEKASLDDVEARWRVHLQPFFGGLLARQVTAELITHYQQKRLEKGAKPATINRELSVLRRAYRLGLRNKRILADHVPYVQMLTENNVRKGFVEPTQYDALVAEFSRTGLWLRTAFECGYTWGFRDKEVKTLRVHQVDLVERVVRLEVGETKNKEGREVPMTDALFELLKACVMGKQPNDYVFTRENGEPIRDFRKVWKNSVKRAGMPGLLFHDLRRSAVRVMVRSGINEKIAMSISGHKTRSVFDRYNIVSKNDKFEAMKKREQHLANVSKNSAVPTHAHFAHTEQCELPESSGSPNPKLLN